MTFVKSVFRWLLPGVVFFALSLFAADRELPVMLTVGSVSEVRALP